MKQLNTYIRYRVFVLLFLLPFFLMIDCSYMSISSHDNLREGTTVYRDGNAITVYNSCVITGTVKSIRAMNYPILVIAYPLSHTVRTIEYFVILERPGPFMLYLPEGSYYLYAIADYNNNALFEHSEVYGFYGNPDEIRIGRDEVKSGISIVEKRDTKSMEPFPQEVQIPDDSSTLTYDGYNGQRVKIYHERFSSRNASIGWWSPTRFMKAYGANIYFTEKYDPKKIPVLFVHGAEGSPQNWVYFYIWLNRAKYQPWFFHYPSGIRLSLAADLLHESIVELKKKYRPRTLCITAHSMGGLVTRSMLTKYYSDPRQNFVKLFITFATPWSGFETADISMAISSKVLPSWMDMASQSAFIKRTMRSSIPDSVHYYMFFGKIDSVSKERALDDRAFAGAKEKIGFDCDHDSILSDKSVFIKYSEILDNEL